MVRSSSPLMAALRAVRSLRLASWCIGAGAVRSLVWDTLHGFEEASPVEDVDVVYFDDSAETTSRTPAWRAAFVSSCLRYGGK